MDLFSKLKDKKILLVDDDEWIRDSLTMYFGTEGCHILAVETAEEGLELLKQEDWDIILTDFKLPGIDGLAFSKKVQGIRPDAIKILITAYKSKEIVSEARSAGIQDLIDKPVTIKTIEDSLSRLLHGKEIQKRP
ncbi:MAG TPA: response regulator [Desulfobacterales bacterium]|nr:response regulator [Desulfobacterales bacterium]